MYPGAADRCRLVLEALLHVRIPREWLAKPVQGLCCNIDRSKTRGVFSETTYRLVRHHRRERIHILARQWTPGPSKQTAKTPLPGSPETTHTRKGGLITRTPRSFTSWRALLSKLCSSKLLPHQETRDHEPPSPFIWPNPPLPFPFAPGSFRTVCSQISIASVHSERDSPSSSSLSGLLKFGWVGLGDRASNLAQMATKAFSKGNPRSPNRDIQGRGNKRVSSFPAVRFCFPNALTFPSGLFLFPKCSSRQAACSCFSNAPEHVKEATRANCSKGI